MVQVTGRQVNDIYRELALENVRGTVVGYDTWKQTAKRYREQLAERGVTGFKDRSGRMWRMTTYSEMVARTTIQEAHTQGTLNRLSEQGHDLIIVSRHRSHANMGFWEESPQHKVKPKAIPHLRKQKPTG